MKISIIIPTLGRPTLPKVLEGIFACRNFEKFQPEILVIVDGKHDQNFEKLIKKFEQRIRILETQKSAGASGARNSGIENATGDVVVFIGDDTIPTAEWLVRLERFHRINPEREAALLGKVSWTPELATDKFHRWLENHAQFAFRAIEKSEADWRHFYTSNISVKKSLIGDDRFSEKFIGWGFEDIEFGFRLGEKSLKLSYDRDCEVLHEHRQTPEQVWKNTKNSRKNALIFEELHPELEVLPRGNRRKILKLVLLVALFFAPFWKPAQWWYDWKKSWLGE
ncbi:glycosyltransferase family 2 protein [bacterium]|nr:glycosyltransferase family 2 protein [bacterium]MBT6996479.1 glycosyltransferase family 2 protein [bacterium]MBT7772503.1 glycosyltransferase family 2 protein [bacterium]